MKHAAYHHLARIGKAVASPRRLELLDLLCQGPRTVEALAGQASMSVANASQHLQVLRAARLVDAEKKGLFVEYRLAGDDVAAFFVALRALGGARLAEIEQVSRAYLRQRNALEAIDADELARRLQRGDVTVIDVRPADEYRAGHIPGALSMPVADLAARVDELPADREVVAYCRGPYCVMAIDAVEQLRARGLRAVRMEQGVAEWRARGLQLQGAP